MAGWNDASRSAPCAHVDDDRPEAVNGRLKSVSRVVDQSVSKSFGLLAVHCRFCSCSIGRSKNAMSEALARGVRKSGPSESLAGSCEHALGLLGFG